MPLDVNSQLNDVVDTVPLSTSGNKETPKTVDTR